jgi:hypothetical protein
MRFIRKNGRIIPIKDGGGSESKKAFSGQHYKAFAAAGAVHAQLRKAAPKAYIALAPVRAVASIANGIQHGRETHSFTQGLLRTFNNDLSGIAGHGASSLATTAAGIALKSPNVRSAATKAGTAFRGSKVGKASVMKNPNRGAMKNVTNTTLKLRGK